MLTLSRRAALGSMLVLLLPRLPASQVPARRPSRRPAAQRGHVSNTLIWTVRAPA